MNARRSTTPATDPLEKRPCGSPPGEELLKEFRSAVLYGRARRFVDELGRRFPERCDCRPGARQRIPIGGTGVERGDFRRDRAAASSNGEHFVTNETNANGFRGFAVEEVCADRLLDVGAQLLPCVSLGDDGLGQTFGNVPPVHLLGHLEYDFGIHAASLPPGSRTC